MTRRELGEQIERLASHVQLVGEAVGTVNERLTRETEDIREEMRHGFAETHSLIRFAYQGLDARVSALERGRSKK